MVQVAWGLGSWVKFVEEIGIEREERIGEKRLNAGGDGRFTKTRERR